MTEVPPSPKPPRRSRRGVSPWRTYRLAIWLILAALTLGIGTAGFILHDLAHEVEPRLPDAVYRAVQLFVLESGAVEAPIPWEIEVARWVAPILGAYVVVLAIGAAFRDQFQRWRIWWMRPGHIVICGLNTQGFLLATRYRALGRRVVVVDRDGRNAHADACRDQGIHVLSGNPTRFETLKRAKVAKARLLVAVGGDLDNIETSVKAELLVRARGGWRSRRRPLECWVHQENLRACRALRDFEGGFPVAGFVREFFNMYESGALALFHRLSPFDQDGLVRGRRPHLLICGLGRLGDSLLTEIARRWRQTAPWSRDAERLRVAVIDPHADAKVEGLRRRVPELARTVEIETIEAGPHDPRLIDFPFAFGDLGSPTLTAAYICGGEEEELLPLALRLHRRCARGGEVPPIVICYLGGHEVENLLRLGQEGGQYARIGVFGLYEETCKPELLASTKVVLKPQVIEPLPPVPDLDNWIED